MLINVVGIQDGAYSNKYGVYLRVVPRPCLVCIDAPFLVFGTRSVEKEGNVVFGSATTSGCATLVALGPAGRVKIGSHLHGTVGCGVLVTGKVEHFDRLGIQHAHHLPCCVRQKLV